ncbi:MAG: isoleucine--tRNA ligase, partial [Thermoleophilia bacterium]|nr:isoleucine--tRNA ligase [Thermoleophilia bacterium]
QVVNLGRAARNAAQIKTRQPVAMAVVAAGARERAALESLATVVAEELNVKKIDYVASVSELVNYQIKPNYRTLGPRFGKNMPAVAAAVAALPAAEVGDRVSSGRSVMVAVGGHEYEFAPEDFVVEVQEKPGYRVEREGALAVAIWTELTPELLREGLARELVHHIQNTRKTAGFEIDDRIHLRVWGPQEIAEMLAEHGEWVQKETLAVTLEVNGGAAPAAGGTSGRTE